MLAFRISCDVPGKVSFLLFGHCYMLIHDTPLKGVDNKIPWLLWVDKFIIPTSQTWCSCYLWAGRGRGDVIFHFRWSPGPWEDALREWAWVGGRGAGPRLLWNKMKFSWTPWVRFIRVTRGLANSPDSGLGQGLGFGFSSTFQPSESAIAYNVKVYAPVGWVRKYVLVSLIHVFHCWKILQIHP